IASITRPGSIIFSRATASAVCKSSSWLADVIAMTSVLLGTAFGFYIIKILLVDHARRLACAQHLADELVGQNELGIAQPVELQPDRALGHVQHHLVALDPGQHTLEPLAPVDRLGGL